MEASQLSEQLRRELLTYLGATSEERARLIGELTQRNPGMADLLADLEADDTLRDRFELELLRKSRNVVARPRYARSVAMLPRMLEDDRERSGWSVGQAAWRLGVSVREYRELEAGARSPSFDGWKAEPPAKTAQGRFRRR